MTIVNKRSIFYGTVAVLCILLVALGIVFVILEIRSLEADNPEELLSGGAVVTNGYECAEIGADILKRGGSAVDAAIAAMFCEGVACPEAMGIGGGFLMTIYSREKGMAETINAREMAPNRATSDMFIGRPGASTTGGLAVATPGEVKGYFEAHRKYGKLEWAEIVRPTIELCRKGHLVTPYFANILKSREDEIYAEPSLREIFINPATNQTWVEGDRVIRPRLADSLEVIAREGSDAIYSKSGSLIRDLVKDIQNFGGIITEDDFLGYEAEWNRAETNELRNGDKIYTMPLPGSGILLRYIMNIMDGYESFKDDSLSWHRLIESFKFAYAERSKLGDPGFVEGIEEIIENLRSLDYANQTRFKIDDLKTYNDYEHYGANFSTSEDHGTAHLSILAPNGDAVAVTGTVNLFFGAKIRSPKTGIIFNDIMDDFSTPGTINEFGVPASPANYIAPKKRPLSAMTPTIVVGENGWPKIIVGAAGGTRITTTAVFLILRQLFLGESLEQAMTAKRVHHQLAPMRITHENGFNAEHLADLAEKEHVLDSVEGIATATAITLNDGKISAMFDPRRAGSVAIF